MDFEKMNSQNTNENKDFVKNTRENIISKMNSFIDSEESYSPEQKEQYRGKIEKAINLAMEIHKDQKPRPDGPYVNHILRVANRLIEEYGINEPELVMAALLHDSVEDQAAKLTSLLPVDSKIESERAAALLFIRNEFGERAEKIVFKLSNPEREPEGSSAEERNIIYKEHVKDAIEDEDVLPIKLSDFSDNGLNLNAVSDSERRLKLSKKYLPVMEVFVERLQTAHNVFGQAKIVEVSERLLTVIKDTKQFIQEREAVL